MSTLTALAVLPTPLIGAPRPAAAAGGPALFWHTGGLLDAVAGWLGAPR